MMSLSIIVPVYNVEKCIRPCIDIIFNQGLDEDYFEVIIINDGTKDRSMEMIADIISQHNNITVDGDIKLFAERLCLLMGDENLRKQFSEAALKKASTFDVDIIMNKWKCLFENCLKERDDNFMN